MSDAALTALAAEILYREALHLDRREWDAWLAMYAEDAVFWVPSWVEEHEPASDPDTQVSLIYHESRFGLDERIMRIRTRKSVTAMPLPRTQHLIGSVMARAEGADAIATDAAFSVEVYDPRTTRAHRNVGRYEHLLRRQGDGWVIARKRIILVNDLVPTTLDFYSI